MKWKVLLSSLALGWILMSAFLAHMGDTFWSFLAMTNAVLLIVWVCLLNDSGGME